MKKDFYCNSQLEKHRKNLKQPKNIPRDDGQDTANIRFMAQEASLAHHTGMFEMWFVNNCSSQYICKNLKYFRNVHKLEAPHPIETADGHAMTAKYAGEVLLVSTIEIGDEKTTTDKDMAYIPTFKTNLLSVPRMKKSGVHVVFPARKNIFEILK